MLSANDICALKQFSESGIDSHADDWDEDKLPEDYLIDHFDYTYIKTCTSIRELKQILAVLRSGKEGIYEDLEKAVADRIKALGGTLKTRPLPPAEVVSTLKKEINDDLNTWLDDLQHKSKAGTNQNLLEHENTKGNEAMRAGDVKEALACYMKCIRGDSSNPKYYVNISLAHLKLKNYDKAIEMATHAISLSPSTSCHYKCLLRRSSAYYYQGRYNLAMNDLNACSAFSETYTDHIQLKKQTEEKWRDVDFPAYKEYMEKSLLTSKTVKIEIVDDSDDEDDIESQEKVYVL